MRAWEALELEGRDIPLQEGSWAQLTPLVQVILGGGAGTPDAAAPEWEPSHTPGRARLRYGDSDVPLDVEGVAPFTLSAWRACVRIPRGETRSYGWLAAEAGRPGAARAAGQAMARKPVPAPGAVPPGHRQHRLVARLRWRP